MSTAVLLATRSAGKRRELSLLLAEYGLRVESLTDVGLVETEEERALESFATFEENALAKARYVAERFPDRVVLADDSGLEVEALDGRPGVLSKRWGGFTEADGAAALDANNNRHLLAELERASLAGRIDRSARFACVASCVWGGAELTARGETSGRILEAPVGHKGFGYDPVFFSDELGVSFGNADGALKNEVSHRGRAFRLLMTRARAHQTISAKLFGPVDPAYEPG